MMMASWTAGRRTRRRPSRWCHAGIKVEARRRGARAMRVRPLVMMRMVMAVVVMCLRMLWWGE